MMYNPPTFEGAGPLLFPPLCTPSLLPRRNLVRVAPRLFSPPLPPRAVAARPRPAAPQPIPLWPGAAPGEKGDVGEEVNKTPADPVMRLTNVTRPTVTVFRPPPG